MTLMITGHRQILPPDHAGSPYPDRNPAVYQHHQKVTKAMVSVIRDYALAGMKYGFASTNFISGMAIGADTLFASAVIAVQDEGLPVRLIAAVPFEDQESRWPKSSQEIYYFLLARAYRVEYVCPPGYAPWKMQKRNEWMVDRSARVLALYDGRLSGGTFNCVMYARGKGRPVMRLHPQTLVLDEI